MKKKKVPQPYGYAMELTFYKCLIPTARLSSCLFALQKKPTDGLASQPPMLIREFNGSRGC